MGSVALADPHDDLVYQRYSQKLKPSPIRYEDDKTFTELTRPATQQDVEKGKAIFTFEGLGPSRVWKLPKCPNFCEWSSLKDYSLGTYEDNGVLKTNFDNCGDVCQAEDSKSMANGSGISDSFASTARRLSPPMMSIFHSLVIVMRPDK